LDLFCWFDQSDPCYAALGHKLSLPLVLGISEYDLKIHKRINNQNDPVWIQSCPAPLSVASSPAGVRVSNPLALDSTQQRAA
ncbi:hypothetical protein M9458_027841, partial [Cirrhinus mrigala]